MRLAGEERPGRGAVTLTAHTGHLDVTALAQESLNFALIHNGISPVIRLTVHNHGPATARDVRVGLALTWPGAEAMPLAAPLVVGCGDIDPGEVVEAASTQLAWRLNPAAFIQLDEPASAVLTLTTEPDSQTPEAEAILRILPADQWWAGNSIDSLAAFVRPNDPAIGALLAEASTLLANTTGNPSLEGYQSGPERVHRIAEAIYAVFQAQYVTYMEPPPSFEGTGQRIRSHGAVLEQRMGTCLDLACTYAAALEQAGLAPVLVVTRNHAFCGYLTEDTQLPETHIADKGAIITIADSDSFDAVETTALCAGGQPVSFDGARGATRSWWTGHIDEVTALVDVRAAHRWFNPLPTIRYVDGVAVVETVVEATPTPARRMPGATARPRLHETAPQRVERWQRSLLDMSYANPLLKLKASTTATLHVPSDALGRLEDLIAADTSVELFPADNIATVHDLHGARTAADVDATILRKELTQAHRLFVAMSSTDYARKLKALQRRATTAREETGTDSLYLALGTLRWQEQSRQGHAPLFLTPVRLSGGRGHTPFRIDRDETREVEPNYCLLEKLHMSFGLDLVELVEPGADGSGMDLDGALQSIRSQLLAARALTFQIEETAHLATFQFSTLGMWRDLRENWQLFMRRPAVAHLTLTPGQPFVDNRPDPTRADTTEATAYLPILADGSQIKAVRWAEAGKSFVLEGPPGTGKSQTITNLIAHCLAVGQKVLFVAEKQAALDVVQRRLDAVGLGPFSLDLHGPNQTISAVREQLKQALLAAAGTEATWDSLRAAYRNLVESLAYYPRQLHEPGPAGLSAWEARQTVLETASRVPAEAPVVLIPRPLDMVAESVTAVYELATALGRALQDLGGPPADSPWRLAGPLPAGVDLDRVTLAGALQALSEAESVLDTTLQTLVLGANTDAHLATLGTWLDAARLGLAHSPAQARQLVSVEWRQYAGAVRAAVDHHRATFGGVVQFFAPEILERDLDALVAQSEAADKKFLFKKKARRTLVAELAPQLKQPLAEATELTPLLRRLAEARHDLARLVPYAAALPGVAIGARFNPFREEDVARLHHQITGWEVSAAWAETSGHSGPLHEAGLAVLRDGGPGGEPVRTLARARSAVLAALRTTPADLAAWARGTSWAEARARTSAQWRADALGGFVFLTRWVRVRTLLQRLMEGGLDQLVQLVLDGRVQGSAIDGIVRLAVAREILAERLDSTNLIGFDAAHRDGLVDQFVKTGQDIREALIQRLPAEIVAARTFDPRQQRGEVGELQQQIGRRRGGLTIRQLMRRFAPIMTEITPCFLMSPNSVAKFLPADSTDFDVVVFDEASQIRVPEAIGAMGRGHSVIIVGDSQQMPPSSMFAAAGANEEDEETADDQLPVPFDMESILTEAVESNLPSLMLSWHYRSRDESLIAFSNEHYYEGRLASFPTPPHEGGTPAVRLRRVDGQWEGGARGARVNRAEADAVVAEVTTLLRQNPARSLGVVTFNTQQRDLILDLLERAAETDELVATALSQPIEPLFVKNLENVQGDERDVVLFTLAFAKDANGRVPLNWGPLTRAGGEKRLNVAVTRAKEQVLVFGSFDPHELDLSGSSSTGLAYLKDYLLLARDGAQRTLSSRPPTRDLHLRDIETRLTAAGLTVRTGVGLSDFTIDLALQAKPAGPWLAVLLDGPQWARRDSVGDRDGLPEATLTKRMGWPGVERIWLPDWIRDAEGVVARLVKVAHSLTTPEAGPPAPPAAPPTTPPAQPLAPPPPHREAAPPAATGRINAVGRPDGATPTDATPEAPSAVSTQRRPFVAASQAVAHSRDLLNDFTRRTVIAIRTELEAVLAAEAPILEARLARLVAYRFGLERVTEVRLQQVIRCIPPGVVQASANGDRVAWAPTTDRTAYGDYRVPGDVRDIGDVPYEELRNAMVDIVRTSYGIDAADLLRESAREFGCTRLGTNVRGRLEGVLEAAIREGRLTQTGVQVRFGAR
jgi:hypothetical protein